MQTKTIHMLPLPAISCLEVRVLAFGDVSFLTFFHLKHPQTQGFYLFIFKGII